MDKIDVTRILGSFKTKWKKSKAVVTYTDEMTKEEMADLNKDPELIQMALDYKKLEFRIMERIDVVLARSRGVEEEWPATVNNPKVIPGTPPGEMVRIYAPEAEADQVDNDVSLETPHAETDLQRQIRKAKEKVKYAEEDE